MKAINRVVSVVAYAIYLYSDSPTQFGRRGEPRSRDSITDAILVRAIDRRATQQSGSGTPMESNIVELISWPDTIYVNASIVTMDDTRLNDNPGNIYQAMAVKGEKILALGSQQRILTMKGPDTQVVDLGGNMVLPGIINSHLHVQGGFTELARVMYDLSSVRRGYYIVSGIRARDRIAKRFGVTVRIFTNYTE